MITMDGKTFDKIFFSREPLIWASILIAHVENRFAYYRILRHFQYYSPFWNME